MENTEVERVDIYSHRHKNILLAEDNEGDIEIFKDICSSSRYPCSLFIVQGGQEVINFLNSSSHPKPDIIVLDINMPGVDGLEALEEIKRNAETSKIPVVMLTSSNLSLDIEKARDLGANGYIVKPVDFNISELVSFIVIAKNSPDTFLEFSNGIL